MSWKLEAAAAIVPTAIAAAPAPLSPAPVAAVAHPAIAKLRAAAVAFRARPNLDGFAVRSAQAADDIAAKLERYGSFVSQAQEDYAFKLYDWSGAGASQEARHEVQDRPATPVAPPKPIGLRLPNLAALVNLDKFARFTVGKLQLSLKNDGSCVWVKWDGAIVGVIGQPAGEYRTSRRYVFAAATHAEAEAELVRIEADPMAAAKANGLLTGRCSCCGRPLTDPNSIAIGIGPICAEKGWG